MSDTGLELGPDRRRALDDFLDRETTDHGAPGASVAIFDLEGVQYARGYGAATLDPVEPATADSLFQVASVTKSFTAIAVLELVDDGALALEDPASAYVDILADAPGDPITVGELLAHTSGIPSDVGFYGGVVANREDFRRRIDRLAENRLEDRDRLMYCNKGYAVLAAVVEQLAGRPFADHVTETLLEPMGMERSTFDGDAVSADDGAMVGYAGDSRAELAPASQGPVRYPALRLGLEGPGGLHSTARELATLGRLLLCDGRVDGEQVVAPETVAAMTTAQGPPAPTVEGFDLRMGYGVLLEEFMGETLAYTGGGMPGYGTFVGVLPDREVGVALGFNHAAVPKIEAGMGALAVVCGEAPREVVGTYRAQQAVEAATGTYEEAVTGREATVEPVADGGLLSTRLAVTVGDGPTVQAAPDCEDPAAPTFRATMGNGFVWTFEFPETDGGRRLVLTRGHRAVRYEKR